MAKIPDALIELHTILSAPAKPESVVAQGEPTESGLISEACDRVLDRVGQCAEYLDGMTKMMHDLKNDLQALQEACASRATDPEVS